MSLLRPPDSGFKRSVGEHNFATDITLDWLEASLLLTDVTISKTDVLDVFMEGNFYSSQDFANEYIEQLWADLRRRKKLMGASSFYELGNRNMWRLKEWEEVPSHAFCLAVSLRRAFDDWSARCGEDYNQQGLLFEGIVCDSLTALGWQVESTGWSGDKENDDLYSIVNRLAEQINEPTLDTNLDLKNSKDAGLDLLCHQSFRDRRAGVPTYLIQCASGENWKDKLHTPSSGIWNKLIDFSAPFSRGIAIPFSIYSDKTFRTHNIRCEGLVLDRFRILSAGYDRVDWASSKLEEGLIDWLGPILVDLQGEAA